MSADLTETQKIKLLPLIDDSIYTSDVELMLKYVDDLISRVDDPKIQLDWMDIFIQIMYKHNERELVQPFFDKLDQINFFSDLQSFPFYIMRGIIQRDILIFLGQSVKNTTFKDVIQNIAESDESEYTRHGCENAEIVFGPQSRNEYISLEMFNETSPSGVNSIVREYLREKLDLTEGSKGVPKWLLKSEKQEKIKRSGLRYKDVYIPSPRKVEKLFKSLVKEGKIDMFSLLKNIKSEIRYQTDDLFVAQYSVFSLMEKFELYRSLNKLKDSGQTKYSSYIDEENVDIDKEMFMRWGPVNTSYEQEIDSENVSFDICSQNGGCRMFTCKCSQNEDYDYDDDEDWFIGKCQRCNNKIGVKTQTREQRKRCALREPLLYGSWSGCFCSFDCINDSIINRYGEKEELSAKNIQLMLTRMIEIQIKTIGVSSGY